MAKQIDYLPQKSWYATDLTHPEWIRGNNVYDQEF